MLQLLLESPKNFHFPGEKTEDRPKTQVKSDQRFFFYFFYLGGKKRRNGKNYCVIIEINTTYVIWKNYCMQKTLHEINVQI